MLVLSLLWACTNWNKSCFFICNICNYLIFFQLAYLFFCGTLGCCWASYYIGRLALYQPDVSWVWSLFCLLVLYILVLVHWIRKFMFLVENTALIFLHFPIKNTIAVCTLKTLARSLGQVKPDSDKWKLWKNLLE